MSLETKILYLFFAGYLITFLMEVVRVLAPSKIRAFYPVSITVIAILLHLAYLVLGAWQSQSVSPLNNWHDWFSLVAWILAVSFLQLNYRHGSTMIGVLLMPMVLVLTAATWYTERPVAEQSSTITFWNWLHALTLLLGTVIVFLGFVAGVMYLLQMYQLKHKTPVKHRFRLPSLEWLERINVRSVNFSVVMLSIGVISGFVLNSNSQTQSGDQPLLQWSQPVVWTSAILLVWIIAILFFEAFYRPARQGQKVAYLTLGSFIFLVVVLTTALLTSDQHGAATEKNNKTTSSMSFERELDTFATTNQLSHVQVTHRPSVMQRGVR